MTPSPSSVADVTGGEHRPDAGTIRDQLARFRPERSMSPLGRDGGRRSCLMVHVRFAPKATESLQRR